MKTTKAIADSDDVFRVMLGIMEESQPTYSADLEQMRRNCLQHLTSRVMQNMERITTSQKKTVARHTARCQWCRVTLKHIEEFREIEKLKEHRDLSRSS